MPPARDKIPWYYCVKNRIWNRRMCKHSACKARGISRMSIVSPKDYPE